MRQKELIAFAQCFRKDHGCNLKGKKYGGRGGEGGEGDAGEGDGEGRRRRSK